MSIVDELLSKATSRTEEGPVLAEPDVLKQEDVSEDQMVFEDDEDAEEQEEFEGKAREPKEPPVEFTILHVLSVIEAKSFPYENIPGWETGEPELVDLVEEEMACAAGE
jgi:hypothetical protein